MTKKSQIEIVVYAQTPPPEHGQSRMVSLALKALQKNSDDFLIHHVDTKFSFSIDEIGSLSASKLLKALGYIKKAVVLRLTTNASLLYYIPGPVKWSAITRDWVSLSLLRLFYPKIIFHWHAIGQGEWAHGSKRIQIRGPQWLDRLARKISAILLSHPYASIGVSSRSMKDARAVRSRRQGVVCNGIEDPCPEFESIILEKHSRRIHELKSNTCFRVLFLSHGTKEKGLIDALKCLETTLESVPEEWRYEVTIAGGISHVIKKQFSTIVKSIEETFGGRILFHIKPYLSGDEKKNAFCSNDIFLSPSKWESFGLTVVEAMAYGMQIVAAKSDGVSGVLPKGFKYLAPVGDPLNLARCLQECCLDLISGKLVYSPDYFRKEFLLSYNLDKFEKNFVDFLLKISSKTNSLSRGVDRSSESGDNLRELSSRNIPVALPLLSMQVYLADQNPGFDRSFGISRMSRMILESLANRNDIRVEAVVSESSQQPLPGTSYILKLPWRTRAKIVRLLTDHLHPLFASALREPDVYYFPKGYLPLLSLYCRPSVVTIHDTIIQYDSDHYPKWRKRSEYKYWENILKHTLRKADRILTVSESSKGQIIEFMRRHKIPDKDIVVTYEPCTYESLPQPEEPRKNGHVLHLASIEPHKKTAQLIRWWKELSDRGIELPALKLVGSLPPEVIATVTTSDNMQLLPFLNDTELRNTYEASLAVIIPSEIEGFGLPALEGYYLGTPACFVKGTSIEEILSVTTSKGAFNLEDIESLPRALNEVLEMSASEIRSHGLKLRETYSVDKVTARIEVELRKTALTLGIPKTPKPK